MALPPPRSLVGANGEITSFVRKQVPQPVQYGGGFNYPTPAAMNGPFKFFVQTPAHFLPDPSPAGVYQSMGVQASVSPDFASAGPQAYGQAYGPQASFPQNSMGQSAMAGDGAPLQGGVAGSPYGSPVAFQPGAPAVPAGSTGSPYTGSPYVSIGAGTPFSAVYPPGPMAHPGLPQGPMGSGASLTGSTPLAPQVPAAFLSGNSGLAGGGHFSSPTAVVPQAAAKAGAAGTSSTATTATKFSRGKKKKKASRCMCF
ncbi:unnamed protein product [Effrenium voratum]|uniref:Uncharacterized protein n=1 Tax=Effrenium voratum TaxID=2562239 RepID=A0AA36ILV1_9DINO|nr:unnamed protein product [Effrenium voratum]